MHIINNCYISHNRAHDACMMSTREQRGTYIECPDCQDFNLVIKYLATSIALVISHAFKAYKNYQRRKRVQSALIRNKSKVIVIIKNNSKTISHLIET